MYTVCDNGFNATFSSNLTPHADLTVHPRTRSDKELPGKVPPELLAEAIDQVRPGFRGNLTNTTAVSDGSSNRMSCSSLQVRFDRKHFDRAVVYYKNERMGDAHPVDFLATTECRPQRTRCSHDSRALRTCPKPVFAGQGTVPEASTSSRSTASSCSLTGVSTKTFSDASCANSKV